MKWIVLVLLLFFSCSVYSLSYNLTSHEVNVKLDKEGNAEVTEKYFVSFPSKGDATEFARLKNEISFDMVRWEQFNPKIKIHFGENSFVKDLQINLADEPTGELLYRFELKYNFKRPAFTRSESGRKVYYTMNKIFIKGLIINNSFVIDEGTTFVFTLPPQSEPEGDMLENPTVSVQNTGSVKSVIVPGSFSSNKIDFGYSYLKQITPSLSIAKLVKNFSDNAPRETQLAIAFVAGFLIIMIYTLRSPIENRLAGFVVKNTDFSGLEEEKE